MAKNSFCYPSMKFDGHPNLEEEEEDKAAATSASNSHRQAEKRRRDRINAQLARLRKLIPKSDKMDKAALLERVVEQVKDMKRKASESSKFFTIPTEIDEVTVECHTDIQRSSSTVPDDHDTNNNKNSKNNNNNHRVLIKVTFCCEDRPDLMTELIRALKGLKLTTIGADIVCLGGRMKSILILDNEETRGGNNNKDGVCNVSAIKQSLMAVLTRIVSWSTTTPSFRVSSKRQRFFFSSY